MAAGKAEAQLRAEGKQIQYNTIKARLYPTPEQAELMEKTFDCCRWIWNQMLSDQKRFYLETDQHFIPTPAKYKKEAPFLKEVDNQALTQEHNKLAQAFRSFFKNPEHFGHPCFKNKKNDRDSYTVCNHEFPTSPPTIYLTRDGIRMTKLGIVKAVFPRRPRSGWKLKRVTVDKTRTGKYYAYILYERIVRKPETVIPSEDTTLGLKYSMSHFYAGSNGDLADPPHWMKESREKLANIQRKLSRMQPGSKNYNEMVLKYRKLNEHIANQRRDYIHKESRRLSDTWDAVCVRGDDLLDLSGIVTMGNVMDSGFGMFRECLRYKLARQGKQLLVVDRYAPSTRTCSVCGWMMREGISTKSQTWVCPECGEIHNREINAARNIKKQGLAQL